MKNYRISEPFHLRDWDPNETSGIASKDVAKNETVKLSRELGNFQTLLYAEHKHKILIVLQGMDTSGKDGTIRRVFDGMNPQGINVHSFRAPSTVEKEHDFLWRVHQKVPRQGHVAIFNRSHYEDVLIARVERLVPSPVWKARYTHINQFEKMLVDEGTTILKFFLHISKDEQKDRLLSRIEKEHKQWKFDPSDLVARTKWSHYQEAYESALAKTSTSWAPWYLIPANKKWYRDWLVSSILVQSFEQLKMKWPEPRVDLKTIDLAPLA